MRGELEGAGLFGEIAREGHDFRGRVVAADQCRIGRDLPHDPDPETIGQRGLERRDDVTPAVDADLRGERLGRDVEFIDVVVPVMEKIPDLLVRDQGVRRVLRPHPDGLVETHDPLVQGPVGPVQRQELPGERRRRRGRQLQFGQRRGGGVQRQVRGRFAQVRDGPALLVGIEVPRVDRKIPGQGDQHPGRDRTLIRLDLRQVAGR